MRARYGEIEAIHGVDLVAKCGGGARPTKASGTPCVGPAQGPRLAYVLSPTSADPARRFTAADALTLARLGFNTVRLGIIWEGLEPGPRGVGANDPRYCSPHRRGTPFPSLGRANPYDPATVRTYLARTDTIVALLAEAGIRVVIDMHQDVWGSVFSYASGATPWNGEGAPAWATCTGRGPIRLPSSWGDAYGVPAVQRAIHHFWANDVRADLQGQFARVWQAVARHYRSDPNVIGYEVVNEPDDFRSKQFNSELQCDYAGPVRAPRSCAVSRADALRDGLIGEIQAADPDHVVLFEPSSATDFGVPESIGITEPLRFDRVALAFHVYGSPAAQLRQTSDERDGVLACCAKLGIALLPYSPFGGANGARSTRPPPTRSRACSTTRLAGPTRCWRGRWRFHTRGRRPASPEPNHLTARRVRSDTATRWRPGSGPRPRSPCRRTPIRTGTPSRSPEPKSSPRPTHRCSSCGQVRARPA